MATTNDAQDDQLLTIRDYHTLFEEAYRAEFGFLAYLASLEANTEQVDNKQRYQDILHFQQELMGRVQITLFLEPENIAFLVKRIFSNEAVRSFVLSLTSRFFLSTNETADSATVHLARLLANNSFANYEEGERDFNLIPPEITNVLRTWNTREAFAENMNLLKKNRWVMTVMLMWLNLTQSYGISQWSAAQNAANRAQPGKTNSATPNPARSS